MRSGARKLVKLLRCLSVTGYRNALVQHHVAAAIEHEALLLEWRHLRSVIDVGANKGQFALAVRQCCPAAQVISFEPLPDESAVFRSVFNGDASVHLYSSAIGPQSGQVDIHLSAKPDSSSLLPITALQITTFPGTGEIGTLKIHMGPLSEFIEASSIESPAMLKLDVQGFELQALAGCEHLLDRFEVAYVECSFRELYAGQSLAADVVEWMRCRDFGLAGIYNPSYGRGGEPIQADFLFRRHSQ